MDLTIYDIILGPVMTDKAYKLNKQFKKLVLRVHSHANKPQVKEALEKLFNVKVEKIRMFIRKGKRHSFKGLEVQKSSEKRAIVTLKEGHSIDIWDQPGVAITPSENIGKASSPEVSESSVKKV